MREKFSRGRDLATDTHENDSSGSHRIEVLVFLANAIMFFVVMLERGNVVDRGWSTHFHDQADGRPP